MTVVQKSIIELKYSHLENWNILTLWAEGSNAAMPFWKPLGLKVKSVFLNPDSRLVVQDVNGSEGWLMPCHATAR